jgi:ribonucleotide reductase class II
MLNEAYSPSAKPVFYRTYSRSKKETWQDVCDRTITALISLGKLTKTEGDLIRRSQEEFKVLSSGRWLWCGGTDWLKKPENVYGAYNCSSTNIDGWEALALIMNLAMQGCGTGAVLEDKYIKNFPVIRNHLTVEIVNLPGTVKKENRHDDTIVSGARGQVNIFVGDSRKGWVDSYLTLLELSSREDLAKNVKVFVCLGAVRNSGEKLRGFGGTANPIALAGMYGKLAKILNGAIGRQLTALELCKLIDEASVTIVAGNIRRSAGMRQGSPEDIEFATAKDNLWQQDNEGNWKIDPDKDCLRMANHTLVYHRRPTLEEVKKSVQKQFHSGEGAIQWAGEAVARANVDLLSNKDLKNKFLDLYNKSLNEALNFLAKLGLLSIAEAEERMSRYATNPCFRGDMKILTKDGYRAFESLDGQDVEIINAEGNVSLSHIWCSGEKETVRVGMGAYGSIHCTPDHSFLNIDGKRVDASELRPGDRLMPFLKVPEHKNKIFVCLGFVQGDGQLSDLKGDKKGQLGVAVNIGKKDQEILEFFQETEGLKCKKHGERRIYVNGLNELIDKYDFSLYTLPFRALPSTYKGWDLDIKASFLSGLYSANGSVLKNGRVTLKTTCREMGEQIVDSLKADFGIEAYITVNRPTTVSFPNGIYQCRESYDVNIQQYKGRLSFFNQINFIHSYKIDKFAKTLLATSPSISVVEKQGIVKVYDFSEPITHWGVVEGFVAHNCGEIVGNNFFCDLAEVHLNTLDGKDLNSLKEAFKAAGLIAAVLLNDKFPDERYQKSRELDPIVGVSFTGLFDFFVNLFGESWLRWWEAGRPTGSEEDFIFGEDLDNWFGAFPKEIKDLIEDYDFTDGDGGLFKEIEQFYLTLFKDEAHKAVWEYCDTHNLKRPNRCTTVQPAGCLDKTAIRVFDQGLIYLDELISPGSGDRDGIGLSVRDGVEVNSAIANQPLNLIKITLKNGRILRMTPNHRLSVGGDWVRADELVRGMKIDFSLGEYSKTEDALLLPINPEHYTREYRELERGHGRGVLTKTISTPNLLNPDIAYMLGCLFGNGYMSDKPHRVRFSFGTTRMDIVSKIQNIVREYFGVEAAIDMYETKLEMCFASKQLTDWLKLNNLHKAEKSAEPDRIPLAVRQSSKETILSFFCGLIDTDGCVRKEGSLSIDSASEKFIRNLQQIGEAIGLSFSVFHNTKGENKQGQKNMWGLCLSRMLSTKTSIDYLNQNSIKCGEKPIPEAKRVFKFDPYQITDIEFETTPDYSFDVAVSGVDDDDSWYWQGGLKSHNTKSLLTGASPGWHPPKAARFIRRITFGRDDAVALACMDYGYSIIPSQSCKDAEGNLLNDPFDPRVTEWLVEIPTKTSWADNIGEDVDISKFSAKAQFDFYLQVQNYYATHNTSATLEIRQEEIGEYAQLLYQNIQNGDGYSSAALLARFDGGETFPRLPFEPISKEKYEDLWGEVLSRRVEGKSFDELLQARLSAAEVEDSQVGPAGCDSDKCLFKEVGK